MTFSRMRRHVRESVTFNSLPPPGRPLGARRRRGEEVAQQAAETAKEAGREHAQQLGASTQDRAGAAAPS